MFVIGLFDSVHDLHFVIPFKAQSLTVFILYLPIFGVIMWSSHNYDCI